MCTGGVPMGVIINYVSLVVREVYSLSHQWWFFSYNSSSSISLNNTFINFFERKKIGRFTYFKKFNRFKLSSTISTILMGRTYKIPQKSCLQQIVISVSHRHCWPLMLLDTEGR